MYTNISFPLAKNDSLTDVPKEEMDTEDQNDELEEEEGEIMDVYQGVPRKKREKSRPSKKKR